MLAGGRGRIRGIPSTTGAKTPLIVLSSLPEVDDPALRELFVYDYRLVYRVHED